MTRVPLNVGHELQVRHELDNILSISLHLGTTITNDYLFLASYLPHITALLMAYFESQLLLLFYARVSLCLFNDQFSIVPIVKVVCMYYYLLLTKPIFFFFSYIFFLLSPSSLSLSSLSLLLFPFSCLNQEPKTPGIKISFECIRLIAYYRLSPPKSGLKGFISEKFGI